jgi:hypothetical protein
MDPWHMLMPQQATAGHRLRSCSWCADALCGTARASRCIRCQKQLVLSRERNTEASAASRAKHSQAAVQPGTLQSLAQLRSCMAQPLSAALRH